MDKTTNDLLSEFTHPVVVEFLEAREALSAGLICFSAFYIGSRCEKDRYLRLKLIERRSTFGPLKRQIRVHD